MIELTEGKKKGGRGEKRRRIQRARHDVPREHAHARKRAAFMIEEEKEGEKPIGEWFR